MEKPSTLTEPTYGTGAHLGVGHVHGLNGIPLPGLVCAATLVFKLACIAEEIFLPLLGIRYHVLAVRLNRGVLYNALR